MRFADAPSYACKGAVCYGVGDPAIAAFVELQRLINAFSTAAGFTPIKTDGLIGPATLAALARVAQVFKLKPLTAAQGAVVTVISATKETTAAQVDALYNILMGVYQMSAPPASTPPRLPPPSTPPTPKTPPSGGGPDSDPDLPPGAKKSKMPWIVGGAIIATALVGGYFIWTSPRAASDEHEA